MGERVGEAAAQGTMRLAISAACWQRPMAKHRARPQGVPLDAVLCRLRAPTSAQLHAGATDVSLRASR